MLYPGRCHPRRTLPYHRLHDDPGRTSTVAVTGRTGIPCGISPEHPVQYATVNGAILAYREFGNGEPLLINVGFGATMDQINDTAVSILTSRYHVYLYDQWGMDRSSGGSANPSIGGYAEDAAGLMTALGHTSMHIY